MRSAVRAVFFLAMILLALGAAELHPADRHLPNAQHSATVGQAQHVSVHSILCGINRLDNHIRSPESPLRFALLFMHEIFISACMLFVLLKPSMSPCENRAPSRRGKVRMNTE